MSRGFLESTAMGFARAITRAMLSEDMARRRGLIQALDPRVRVVGLLSLVVAVTLCRKLTAAAALLALATALALSSRVDLSVLLKRVWLVVLLFTGIIALPAIFLTPGTPVGDMAGAPVTQQGLRAAGMLILRVEAAVTFTTVLVLCTPWPHVLKALRALLLPREVIAMLAMTHRYIFVLVETATQMFESRRSRTVGVMAGAERRRIAARTAGVLLSKSVSLSEEVYLAMQSRGFRGDVQVLSEFHLTMWDYAALALFWLAAGVAVWKGR